MAADWSILQQPNFGQAALAGYSAGAKIGKQRRLDAALGNVDLENPATIMPVLNADPSTGAALLSTSMKMAEYKHELAGKAATSDYLIKRLGLDTSSASSENAPPAPLLPVDGAAAVNGVANSALAPAFDQPGDIVVNAPHVNPEAARIAMIKADPEQYIKLETSLSTMDVAKRKAVDAANDTFGSAVEAAKAMPYEQRRAYIASQRDQLIAHGVPAQQVDAFDPTDQNIIGIENQVLGIKGILEQKDKDRSFAETQRSHHANESVAAGNLSVNQGRLGLARTSEARSAKAGVGGMSTSDLLRIAGGE